MKDSSGLPICKIFSINRWRVEAKFTHNRFRNGEPCPPKSQEERKTLPDDINPMETKFEIGRIVLCWSNNFLLQLTCIKPPLVLLNQTVLLSGMTHPLFSVGSNKKQDV